MGLNKTLFLKYVTKSYWCWVVGNNFDRRKGSELTVSQKDSMLVIDQMGQKCKTKITPN